MTAPRANKDYKEMLRGKSIDWLLDRVHIPSEQECWTWSGYIDPKGYGVTGIKGKTVRAHRLVFYLMGSYIKKGMVIDHMCRNRACVNPSHLREVTPSQNTMENSNGIGTKNAKATHCQRGHEFNKENTYLNKIGGKVRRTCKTCVKFSRKASSTKPTELKRKIDVK